jgi:hypothetical protein
MVRIERLRSQVKPFNSVSQYPGPGGIAARHVFQRESYDGLVDFGGPEFCGEENPVGIWAVGKRCGAF